MDAVGDCAGNRGAVGERELVGVQCVCEDECGAAAEGVAGEFDGAGAVAGAVAATAVTPADVIKTRQQTSGTGPGSKRGVIAVGRELIHEGGLSSLFRGLGPRLMRIPIYTAITLATFDFVKDVFLATNTLGVTDLHRGEL